MDIMEPTATSFTSLRRYGRLSVLTLFSILSVSMALWGVWPRVTAIAYASASGAIQLKTMPWVFHGAARGNRLQVTLPVRWLTPRVWRVVPDDELLGIVVDGQTVPLTPISPAALTDWGKGFEFDFSPWLKSGKNTIEFTLNNRGGDGGLLLHPKLGWRWAILYAAFLPWIYTLVCAFRLRAHQWLPICLALGVICAYWSVTPWTVRAHDVSNGDGHIDYVIRVADTLTLPKPNEGWELFQPPLYYLGGAAICSWARWLHLPGPESLQAYSLALWLVFLAASAAVLQIVLRRRKARVAIAATAVALWPSGIILSICITNDIGLYACCGMATLMMVRWWHGARRHHLVQASFWVGLALLTKTSALVLVGALGMLLLLRLLRHQRWRHTQVWWQCLLAMSIVGAGFMLSVGKKMYYYRQGMIPDWLTGNSAASLGDWLKVPAKLANFIPLDIPTFVTVPWLTLTDDASGRSNFWNVLLRSSLLGEFHFSGQLQQYIAWGWGGVLLMLLVFALRQAHLLTDLRIVWRQAPWLALGVLWIASLISFRIHVAYACNNDFRYVLPVIVPFVATAVGAGAWARCSLVAMALGSVWFFTTLPYG